ncbi:liprin-beta-1-like isoform X2 [Uloborus diversus]|uniref:liprin-beta-1-like isoform X2 n=1 Tax=Uloborus diversus TaxID=327109 RepID=UPI00240A51DD|nr:liprin-beta-1-like isoform X2 [Uloborus diversus]
MMKTRPNMDTSINSDGGQQSTSTTGVSRSKQDGEDTDDDDDDRDEPVTVTTSVADSCSASHEFEWLSPGSQGIPCHHVGKQIETTAFAEASEQQQSVLLEEPNIASCQVSPARSSHHRHYKPPAWPRRSADINDHMRLSPSPCHELHGCRRYPSPMRSSWCCPSPPPHTLCLHHHGGSILSGLELVPYNRECFSSEVSFWPYQNCSCLPPTGLSNNRYQESHSWCRNPSPHHEVLRRESSSPCAMHRPCQAPGGSRRSRSTSSRKRDSSPSALSPRYSPVPSEQLSTARNSGHEQWQIPVHSDDISNIQKVQTLESEKKNLILQASVLADQVEAQADKINELERIVQLKKEEFIRMEQNLHQEMMTRSSLENNKLELMTELSNLRLRLTAAERDRKESDDKCRKFESELILLQARLYEQEAEHAALKGKLSRNINLLSSSELSEIDRLKSALDSVMNSNDEKDQKIEDLRTSLNNYKKLQDIVLSSHVRKVSDSSTRDAPTFDTDSHVSSIGSTTSDIFKVPATIASMSSVPSQFDQSLQSQNSSTVDKTFSNHCSSSTFHKSNSVENICLSSGMVMPAKTQYGTVPRQTGTNILQQLQSRLQEPGADNRSLSSTTDEKPEASIADSVNKTLGKNSRTLGGTGHKSSGVSFAQECITIPSGNKENFDFVSPLNSQPYLIKNENRNKGFLKFFSKWKRSGSQNIDKVEDNFRRGGIRATAGPRLGWSRDIQVDPDIPFCKWSTEMISEWFCKLGLNSYVNDCKRWMCNGEILSKATPQDLEKELNIKNHLHKKKLLLAIKSMTSSLPNLPSSINMLDYHWVVRWLDDVGLPQYKDSFAEARVDGRVLHCLTVEDLLFLKVSSQLHHTSIKRGIQVLREKSFDPHCLVRRSLPDEIKPYSPDVVALWSNHRVMEWLRTVDLSEYAPNLRGSGVHGALIIHEPRFNSNLLATLLNIPPNKTLLRRHLATHFKHIVGDPLMQVKREKETETPLSPSVKVKIVRKPQFALKKKRNKSELDNEEYICPMDIPVSNESAKYPEGDKLVVRRNSDPSPQDQRHMDLKEETVERIGAVSKDISNLTSMLQSDQLSEAQTTVV